MNPWLRDLRAVLRALRVTFGFSSSGKPKLIAVINGPTWVTLKVGPYFPQDPANRLVATLEAGQEFPILESRDGNFKGGGGRFHLIRLSSGETGYVREGVLSAPDTIRAYQSADVVWVGGHVSDVTIKKRGD